MYTLATPGSGTLMAIPSGIKLGSDEVVAQIGACGMGAVYEAEDLKLRRHVALKFCLREYAKDLQAKERFELDRNRSGEKGKQMRKFHTLLISLLLILSLDSATAALQAATKRGVTPEDYFSFKFVGDPQLSPDGKLVAYMLTTIDQKKNRRDSSIWLVPADGSHASRRLSLEGFSSNAARWRPDGRTLAFLSARNVDPQAVEAPKPQIYLLPILGGGEAVALTKLKNGVQGFQWSPDGSRIVCVSTSGPSDSISPADRKSDVRHYAHMRYKFNDTGWFDDKRSHLWVISVGNGDAQQITNGQDWDDTDPQWSPDGTRIAFVSDRTGKAYDDSDNTDVWVIPANSGTLTKISDHAFEDESPRWSPDGQQIVFTGKTETSPVPKALYSGHIRRCRLATCCEWFGPDPRGTTLAEPRRAAVFCRSQRRNTCFPAGSCDT
jgi:WD40-like Beta Propeller Repeat